MAKKSYNKYRVAPKEERTLDGITFASKREMNRYAELKLLESSGQICGLRMQPRFDIIVNGINCGFWKGDFYYEDDEGATVEDAKGMKTPLYKLKKKLVEAIYGFGIVEV